MMCIQSPGSFLFAYSLAVRPGTNWSSWITYLCTGILQAVLLGMCIVWQLREKREERKGKGIARNVDETTALLDDHEDWFVTLFCMAFVRFILGCMHSIIQSSHSVIIMDLNAQSRYQKHIVYKGIAWPHRQFEVLDFRVTLKHSRVSGRCIYVHYSLCFRLSIDDYTLLNWIV